MPEIECYLEHQKHEIPWDSIIQVCSSTSYRLRSRAVVSITALTGARVNEISRLKRGDFEIDKEKDAIYVRLRNSKRREAYPTARVVFVDMIQEKELVSPLLAYLSLVKDPNQKLFQSTRSCQRVIKEMTGHGAHCLRHTLLTRLAQKYRADSLRLAAQTGWKTTDQAARYAHLNVRDLEEMILARRPRDDYER